MDNGQKKALVTRFAKIEGHVRSIKNMTEDERDLETIMQQIAAVKKAMDAAAKLIYTEQMKELIEQGELDETVIKRKLIVLYDKNLRQNMIKSYFGANRNDP